MISTILASGHIESMVPFISATYGSLSPKSVKRVMIAGAPILDAPMAFNLLSINECNEACVYGEDV